MLRIEFKKAHFYIQSGSYNSSALNVQTYTQKNLRNFNNQIDNQNYKNH